MHDFELYGFSLFETIFARKGSLPFLERHWQRLHASAMFFNMQPPDFELFAKHVRQAHDAAQDQVIRVSLMRHGGRWQPHVDREDRLVIQVRALELTPPQPQKLTVSPMRLPVGDFLRQHKTGNRLVYQSAWECAAAAGFDDCLFVDTSGQCLETTFANVLIYLDGTWCTPPMSAGLLPGVMRGKLLEEGRVLEREVTLQQLKTVPAIAVCNAVKGVVPVAALDGQTFDVELVTRHF